MTNISEGWGDYTFLISGENDTKVVLHRIIRVSEADELLIYIQRIFAATKIFGEHSVGPGTLAYGSDWFIEKHQGIG